MLKLLKTSFLGLLFCFPYSYAFPVDDIEQANNINSMGATLTSVPHPDDRAVLLVDPQSSAFRKYSGINWLHKLSDPVKSHCVAGFSEFFGTFLFLFTAFLSTTGVQRLGTFNGLDAQTLLVISSSFGIALAVAVWLYGSSHFNPSVTMAQLLLRIIGPVRALILMSAQIAGGLSATALTKAIYGKSLVITRLNGINELQGLIVESFGVSALIFTVLMLSVRKHQSTQFVPIAVGSLLTVLIFLGGPITGGSFNYFRSLTASIVENDFPHEHWIYAVSNILGSGIATGLYRLIEELSKSSAILTDADPQFGLALAQGGEEIVLQSNAKRARTRANTVSTHADGTV